MSPASVSIPSAAPPVMPISQGVSDLSTTQPNSTPAMTSQIPGDVSDSTTVDVAGGEATQENTTSSSASLDITDAPTVPETDGVLVISDTGTVTATTVTPSQLSPTSNTPTPSSSISTPDQSAPSGQIDHSHQLPQLHDLNHSSQPNPVDPTNQPTQPDSAPTSTEVSSNNDALIPPIDHEITPAQSFTPLASTVSQPDSAPTGEPQDQSESSQLSSTTDTNISKSSTKKSEANKSYVNLLDVLVDQKVLDQNQANEFMTQSIKQNRSIDLILEEANSIPEEVLAQARATFYKVPYVKLADVGVYPEALSLIPESAARLHGVLPFSVNQQDHTLSVAMRNPLDVTTVNFVEQKTGMRVISYFAAQSEIERFIAEHYAQNLSSEVSQAVEQTEEIQKKQLDYSDLSGKTIREAPVTKIVQTILMYSLKTRASDVHIEPQEDKTRVRYRIDGILQEKLILPKSVHNAVVSRIKILSGLKIDERRLPQDGRFDFTDHDTQVDLRVSTLPTIHGEKVVMRLLKKNSQVPTLEQLGLNGLALRNMSDAIKVPHGIILVTGPTGSGKTTTLYSVLHTINSPRVNIMTLEDPVEYMMSGVNQVQINPQAGLTFASGLRSFLRQDPNIIMVGEIRDSETANLAVQASLTGHLVFSTLHTSSAAGAIPRLMDMGAEPFLLASSMTLVVAQRIARVINPEYKETYKPDSAVIKDIQAVLGERFDIWLKEHNLTKDTLVLTRAAEKRPETEPEYKGRIAIFEVMKISDEVSHLILARKPASDLEEASIKAGMLLMKQDGYLKVLEGITTIEEVLRIAQI